MGWFIRKTILFGFLAGALSIGATAAYVQILATELPELSSLKDYKPPITSNLYDRKGQLIDRFFKERRSPVAFSQIPKHVINAFVAAEDAAFFEHHGIDYMAVIKAGLNEIKYRFVGGKRRGGSTITQQTAKTFFLSPERTYTRKIKEMLLAKRIEENFTKEEILFLYLNQIYFGKGAYGVEEAAQTYYGTSISNITLGQAAVLASIPKSPNKINPEANPKRVQERRSYVLQQMRQHHLITEDDFAKAQQEPVRRIKPSHPYLNSAPYFTEEVRRQLKNLKGVEAITEGGYQIFSTLDATYQQIATESLRSGLERLSERRGWRGPAKHPDAREQNRLWTALEKDKNIRFTEADLKTPLSWDLSKLVDKSLDRPDQKIHDDIHTVPLVKGARLVLPVQEVNNKERLIYVDLGSRLGVITYTGFKWAQVSHKTKGKHKASTLVRKGDLIYVQLTKIKGYRNFPEFRLLQRPQAQGAIVAIAPHSREILALVGGYDFSASKFNRATQAKRQPGSALKPFLYTLALAQKKVTPASVITDAPKVYVDPQTGERWQPNNSSQNFQGDISLRRCLVHSINTCSIELLDDRVSIKDFLEFSTLIGLNTNSTPFPKNLSISLGTPEITLTQLVNAYAIFPTQGRYKPVTLLKEVKNPTGQQLYAPSIQEIEVISPQVAFLTTKLLEDVVQNGTAKGAKQLGRNVAGKTGTTNEARSAWFIGYTPDLVVGVYVGMDDNSSLGKHEYGSKAALPIWRSFMRQALANTPNTDFPTPQEGIVQRIVHRQTGLLADLSNNNELKKENEADNFQPGSMLSGLLNQVFEKLGQNQPDSDSAHTKETDAQKRTKLEGPYLTGSKPLPEDSFIEYFLKGTEPTDLNSSLPPPPIEILEGMGFAP